MWGIIGAVFIIWVLITIGRTLVGSVLIAVGGIGLYDTHNMVFIIPLVIGFIILPDP